MPALTLCDAAWNGCVAAFLRASEERSGSTRTAQSYESILRCFFADPARSPCTYRRADVEAFLHAGSFDRSHAGRPVSVATRNSRLSCLSSFYAFASSYSAGDAPLFAGMPPTAGLRYAKPDIRYRAMSAEELVRLFAVIPETLAGMRDRAFFATVFWTARRLSEILRLRVGDIEPATIVGRDGAHAGYVYRYTGKGASRETKTAELPLPAYQAIDRYLTRSGRTATITPDDPLFCAVYPGRGRKTRERVPLSHTHIEQQFHAYIRAAGLDDARRLTIHSLRHTASRLRYESGSDVREIQQLLAHTSLATTDRYLRTLAPVHDRGAMLVARRYGTFG